MLLAHLADDSDGPGASSSFNVSHSETRVISDWRVDETTQQNATSWLYSMQHPYNSRQSDAWKYSETTYGWVEDMPALSTSSLQISTSNVWRSPGTLTGAQYFDVQTVHRLESMRCSSADALGWLCYSTPGGRAGTPTPETGGWTFRRCLSSSGGTG